ncbi:nitrite reductase small subunit NirD [Streptacidiphilus sp. P02-A3a]|uniref:nitrite reductase small subunit NirD n=1 Tax=Streptacidiphilus sp. P02-A3a TaxID=2704468 RepID=UPI0015FB4768|nr:nitrite reductase small subunit NirD [Streptacidiphilus sp. P02-A3a]QMU67333.1 nitrite reductase small subunit NirD [Streptacidiphilus sp. P02-A3a]
MTLTLTEQPTVQQPVDQSTHQPSHQQSLTSQVEIHDGRNWTPVCALADLTPGRGTALLVDGQQVAAFRDRAGQLYALDNRDPFSGAYVLARGLLGTRGQVPVLISPMYKQAFDLRDGTCLDEDTAPDGNSSHLRTWPIRLQP